MNIFVKPKDSTPAKPDGPFFTHFDFSIYYYPGSKNGKTKPLSHLHAPDDFTKTPEPVIAPHLIVSPIQWSLEEQLSQANASENPLGVHQNASIFHVLNVHLSLPQFTPQWALVTQGPVKHSYCRKITSGGQVWLKMLEGLYKDAQIAPSRKHCAIYHQASPFLCPFLDALGHT